MRGDGIVAVSGSLDGAASRAARPPRRRRPRDRHGHRGRRRDRRSHRRRCVVARRAPARRAGRGAPRRPAAVPVPLRRRVTEPTRRFAISTRARCRPAQGRRREEAGVAARGRHRHRARPAHAPTRGAGSTARTRRGSATCCPGRRRWCWSRVRSVTKRHDAQPADDGRRRRSATAAGGCRSCSSTSRGGRGSCARACRSPCSARSRCYRGGLQMTNPVVDLIGDRTGRIVPVYPQSEKAALIDVGDRRLGRGGAAQVPAAGHRRPGAGRRARPLRLDRPRRGVPRDPHARVDAPRRSRPAAGWRSTSCCGCSSSLVHAQARARARVARRSATTSTASWCGRFHDGAAVRAHRRAAARDRRDRRRPRRAAPDAPAAAGRRRRRQDARRRQRAARRRAGRPPGRVDGADRGARRAARPRRARAARRRRRCPTPSNLFGDRPAAGRAAHQPDHRRPSAATCWPGWPTARVDLAHRHPRADPGGRARSTASAWW